MEKLICCPCNEKSEVAILDNEVRCEKASCVHHKQNKFFRVVNGKPVLISEENCDTVCSVDNVKSLVSRGSEDSFGKKLRNIVPSNSTTTKNNCQAFTSHVNSRGNSPRVLIIGSGEKGNGTEALFEDENINIVGTDVYDSELVDYIADGHYLPFKSDSFDGVWIQAVLEHVLDPQKVVEEIHRVLKMDGMVYAETPFMQQVHEGAYDYTRFTVLGHRYLFKKFEAIEIGGNKSAALAFSWSARYLAWAITRSKTVARIIGVTTDILSRPLGYLVDKRSYYDSSSGVFFLGKKSVHVVSHKEIPPLYRGMQ